jgi:hypothetical protein
LALLAVRRISQHLARMTLSHEREKSYSMR